MKTLNAYECETCGKLIDARYAFIWHDYLLDQEYATCSTQCKQKLMADKKSALERLKFSSNYAGEIDVITLDETPVGTLFSGNAPFWTYRQHGDIRLQANHMRQIADKMEKLENER